MPPISTRKGVVQQLSVHISPPFPDIKIFPVQPEGHPSGKICVLVEVPQSDTAHQAGDGRYHQRANATTAILRDHSIRDLMNRAKNPDLRAEMRMPRVAGINPNTPCRVQLALKNFGKVLCREYQVMVVVPLKYQDFDLNIDYDQTTNLHDNQTTKIRYERTFKVGGQWASALFISGKEVMFPESQLIVPFWLRFRTLENAKALASTLSDKFLLRVNADNMPKVDKWCHAKDIETELPVPFFQNQ